MSQILFKQSNKKEAKVFAQIYTRVYDKQKMMRLLV